MPPKQRGVAKWFKKPAKIAIKTPVKRIIFESDDGQSDLDDIIEYEKNKITKSKVK